MGGLGVILSTTADVIQVVREIHCLRRGGVAFSPGDHQVIGYRVEEVIKVKVRFKGSKRNQRMDAAILIRQQIRRVANVGQLSCC